MAERKLMKFIYIASNYLILIVTGEISGSEMPALSVEIGSAATNYISGSYNDCIDVWDDGCPNG